MGVWEYGNVGHGHRSSVIGHRSSVIDLESKSISRFVSSIVLKLCSAIRNLSSPSGTVGYKIGLTSRLFSRSCAAAFFTFSLPGRIKHWIGVVDFLKPLRSKRVISFFNCVLSYSFVGKIL